MRGEDSDEQFQARILEGVSRTFALTIPQLPPALATVVGNAYLLCRIADTIEDDARLSADDKRRFSAAFVRVIESATPAEAFAATLAERLSPATPVAERELVRNTATVVRLTHGFSSTQQQALLRCVRVMSRGMSEFQSNASLAGLPDLAAMDRYCYHVAGVVGEMLTELFCDYSADIGRHREELLPLAVSFGQGLQMTNILKDLWEDRRRGACWLPRSVFEDAGFDLSRLSPGTRDSGFETGMNTLLGVARGHLRNALEYTLLLPRQERGIRRFCLWALGMAVLTLRRIHARLDFIDGSEVKIPRRSVRATMFVTSMAVGHDLVLRLLFETLTKRLPVSGVLAGTVST